MKLHTEVKQKLVKASEMENGQIGVIREATCREIGRIVQKTRFGLITLGAEDGLHYTSCDIDTYTMGIEILSKGTLLEI